MPKTHCIIGHEFTEENTRRKNIKVKGRPYVARICRACHRNHRMVRWYFKERQTRPAEWLTADAVVACQEVRNKFIAAAQRNPTGET